MNVEQIVRELQSERDRINRAIIALDSTRLLRRVGRPAGKKRRLSAEGRRRIAEAAKRRWAKFRAPGKKK